MSEQTCATCASLKEQVARLTKEREDADDRADGLQTHVGALKADADALRAALTPLRERLESALDFVMGLETPAVPNPSAWTDSAWCHYWRGKRLAAAHAIQEAIASGSRTPEPPQPKEQT